MSIKAFTFAYSEEGPLTPLQRLLWMTCCDTGLDQEFRRDLAELSGWAGSSVIEVKEALAELYESGRLENIQFSGDGTVWVRTKFAAVFARESTTKRDVYRKATISVELRRSVMIAGGHRCAYCGAEDVPLECDHVMPEVRGGETSLENLVPACRPCNQSKGAKTPEEWREWKEKSNVSV